MSLIFLKETKKEILKDKKPESVVFALFTTLKNKESRSKNSKDYFFLKRQKIKTYGLKNLCRCFLEL